MWCDRGPGAAVRDDLVDEFLDGTGAINRREHEAVPAGRLDEGLQLIGHALHRADKLRQTNTLTVPLRHLMQSHRFPRWLHKARLHALQLGLSPLRHHGVERDLRGVVIGLLIPVERRHHIPRRAATGEVIDRRPETRRVERMLVAGREGGAEPDMFRHCRQPGNQRDRIVLRRLRGVAQRRLQRAPESVRDIVEVGKEDHVEEAPFADPSDVLVECRPGPVVLGECRPGMPPHGETVIAGSVHQELCKVDFWLFRHGSVIFLTLPSFPTRPDVQRVRVCLAPAPIGGA